MKLAALFLANHLELHQGLLYVHGGFPAWVNAPAVPSDIQLQVGLVVELDDGEEAAPVSVDLAFERSEPAEILGEYRLTATPAAAAEAEAEVPRYLPFPPLALGLRVEAVGGHALVVRHGGVELGRTRFGLRVAPTAEEA